MASFAIHYTSPDPHSPLNGDCQPLAGGAAIMAEWPGFQMEFGGDWHDVITSDFDNMGVGESDTLTDDEGGELRVTRIA